MLNNETCNEYKQNTGSSVYIMNIYVLHVYVTSNCMYASSVGIITPSPEIGIRDFGKDCFRWIIFYRVGPPPPEKIPGSTLFSTRMCNNFIKCPFLIIKAYRHSPPKSVF